MTWRNFLLHEGQRYYEWQMGDEFVCNACGGEIADRTVMRMLDFTLIWEGAEGTVRSGSDLSRVHLHLDCVPPFMAEIAGEGAGTAGS